MIWKPLATIMIVGIALTASLEVRSEEPFGLSLGMTAGEIEIIGDMGSRLFSILPPKPDARLDTYAALISPFYGLCMVRGSTSDLDDEALLDLYSTYIESFTERLGTPLLTGSPDNIAGEGAGATFEIPPPNDLMYAQVFIGPYHGLLTVTVTYSFENLSKCQYGPSGFPPGFHFIGSEPVDGPPSNKDEQP